MADTPTPAPATLVNPIMQKAVDDARRLVDSIYTPILENTPRGQIQETEFLRYFLPFFRRDPALPWDDEAFEETVMRKWLFIAGSPKNEVNVVDPAGRVLCTVPAVMGSIKLSPKTPGQAIPDLFQEIQRAPTRVVAGNLAETGFSSLSTTYHNEDSELATARQAWMELFARYEKSMPAAASTEASPKVEGDAFE